MYLSETALSLIKDTEEVLSQVSSFMRGENSVITIDTEEHYSGAAVLVKAIKQKRKEIEEQKDKDVRPFYDEYVAHRDAFNPALAHTKEKIDALERAGREYRARVQAAAAEAQRQLELKANQERLAKEEAARKAAQKAEAYEAQGRADKAAEWAAKAEDKQAEAAQVVAPIVQAAIPKNDGRAFNTRAVFKARIIDAKAVMSYMGERGVPVVVLEAVQKWADAQARSAKIVGDSPYPGIWYYSE